MRHRATRDEHRLHAPTGTCSRIWRPSCSTSPRFPSARRGAGLVMNLRSFQLGASALAFGASVAVYRWLPERMPTHFDLAGAPNGATFRPFEALPAPPYWSLALSDLPRLRGPPRGRDSTSPRARLVRFFLRVNAPVLNAAPMEQSRTTARGSCSAVSSWRPGFVLQRVPRNRWVGVRTPWSMRLFEAWARSQRAGGARVLRGRSP